MLGFLNQAATAAPAAKVRTARTLAKQAYFINTSGATLTVGLETAPGTFVAMLTLPSGATRQLGPFSKTEAPLDLHKVAVYGAPGATYRVVFVGTLDPESAPPVPSIYEAAVLKSGPVGYWKLGEASGVWAMDSGPYALHAQYQNAPALGVAGAIADDPNTAVAFNGVDEYVALDAKPQMQLGDTFTYECWVKASSFANSPLLISQAGLGPLLRCDPTGAIVLQTVAAGGGNIATSLVPVILNQWTHVVATKNGADAHLYLNGVDVTGLGPAHTVSTADTRIVIGAYFGSNFLSGSMDEVAIYNRALSAAEVLAHYHAARPDPYNRAVLESGPAGFWPLSETSGTAAYDASGNGLTGVYQNAPSLGVPGPGGSKAVLLNGTTQYATVPDTASLDVLDNFTVECWLKPDALIGGMAFWDKGPNGLALLLHFTNYTVYVLREDYDAIAESTVPIVAGVWAHVVFTKSGAAMKIYLNGVDRTGATQNLAVLATTNPLTIGRYYAGGNYWKGALARFAVYPRVLPIAEVQAHYTVGA